METEFLLILGRESTIFAGLKPRKTGTKTRPDRNRTKPEPDSVSTENVVDWKHMIN